MSHLCDTEEHRANSESDYKHRKIDLRVHLGELVGRRIYALSDPFLVKSCKHGCERNYHHKREDPRHVEEEVIGLVPRYRRCVLGVGHFDLLSECVRCVCGRFSHRCTCRLLPDVLEVLRNTVRENYRIHIIRDVVELHELCGLAVLKAFLESLLQNDRYAYVPAVEVVPYKIFLERVDLLLYVDLLEVFAESLRKVRLVKVEDRVVNLRAYVLLGCIFINMRKYTSEQHAAEYSHVQGEVVCIFPHYHEERFKNFHTDSSFFALSSQRLRMYISALWEQVSLFSFQRLCGKPGLTVFSQRLCDRS